MLGLLIQQAFSRSLLRSPFNQVLLTLGLAFIISNAILYFWDATPRLMRPPEQLRTSREVFGVFYPQYRLFLIVLSFVAAGLLYLIWDRSRIGAIVRACVDDRAMAAAMGIRVDLVFAAVFTAGSALAGMTGVVFHRLAASRAAWLAAALYAALAAAALLFGYQDVWLRGDAVPAPDWFWWSRLHSVHWYPVELGFFTSEYRRGFLQFISFSIVLLLVLRRKRRNEADRMVMGGMVVTGAAAAFARPQSPGPVLH